MHTQTPIPDYAAAWVAIKDDVYVAFSEGQNQSSSGETALIEPGIRLLELSAAYRAAHAAYNEALTAALKGQCSPLVSATTWRRLEDEQKAAESAMNAAREALLSAALDIT